MDMDKRRYYREMVDRGRGTLGVKDGRLVSIVTYFVGDDDNKYLLFHKPWTVIDDDPQGTTLYIDQMLTYKGRSTYRIIHREFTRLLKQLKKQFPNIKRVKWVRVGAQFRKHGKIEGVTHGKKIHTKNLTF
jgi:hypothetical protein